MQVLKVLVLESPELNSYSRKRGVRRLIRALRESYEVDQYDAILLRTSMDYHVFPKILRKEIEPCYLVAIDSAMLDLTKGTGKK